jgi:hypothetical protein
MLLLAFVLKKAKKTASFYKEAAYRYGSKCFYLSFGFRPGV